MESQPAGAVEPGGIEDHAGRMHDTSRRRLIALQINHNIGEGVGPAPEVRALERDKFIIRTVQPDGGEGRISVGARELRQMLGVHTAERSQSRKHRHECDGHQSAFHRVPFIQPWCQNAI